MIYSAPVPAKQALEAHAVKSVLPTTGRTRDLQQLDSAMKQRALWSATVAIAEPLQLIGSSVQGILAGETDQATQRLAIKQLWEQLGYKPDPEQAGGLLDLSSTKRIDLQIETNVATARGAGWYAEGQQPDVLDEFPAQELYDTAPGGKARRDWQQRWMDCGGKFYDGRMIAMKDDEIWSRLGDPQQFPDGLGNPWPPFAFNSHWRVRDVNRDDAIALGVMDAGDQVQAQPLDLTADLEASPELRQSWLQQAIEDSGLGTFQNGALVFKEGGA